jgi:hypothetical protein
MLNVIMLNVFFQNVEAPKNQHKNVHICGNQKMLSHRWNDVLSFFLKQDKVVEKKFKAKHTSLFLPAVNVVS